MGTSSPIIELRSWLQTPAGCYLCQWEQQWLDEAVGNAFGYHAIQLGLPALAGLRENRMPHRWVAADRLDELVEVGQSPEPSTEHAMEAATPDPSHAIALYCDFDALPFPNQSVDLVVLPHGLEWTRDPHLTLAEVERVLVPEGRVVILGLNPHSLWGLRHQVGRLLGRLSQGQRGRAWLLPGGGEWLGLRRVRDWLKLLSFEVETARFGCWRPALQHARWLDKLAWMDRWGERWWPALGAVYCIIAVKRVRGIRLVGLARRQGPRPAVAPAVATSRRDPLRERGTEG